MDAAFSFLTSAGIIAFGIWVVAGTIAAGSPLAYRHCGFDQPLSNNWRCQNRVAVRDPEPSTWAMPLMGSDGFAGIKAHRR